MVWTFQNYREGVNQCIPPGFAVPIKISPCVQRAGPEKVLQEYHCRTGGRTPPPVTDLDGFQHFAVDKILFHQRNRRGLQYLIKRIGYADATWEPERFLLNEAGQDLDPLKLYKAEHPHWVWVYLLMCLEFFLSSFLSDSFTLEGVVSQSTIYVSPGATTYRCTCYNSCHLHPFSPAF